MKLKIAFIISIIALIMLVIYGLDAVAANGHTAGFLPLNVSLRGTIFGIIPSALLIIAFFITRKEPSKKLGGLILAGGALIIAGAGLILVLQPDTPQDARALRELVAVFGIGIIIAALGIIKIKKT
jgi:hypothetical protein